MAHGAEKSCEEDPVVFGDEAGMHPYPDEDLIIFGDEAEDPPYPDEDLIIFDDEEEADPHHDENTFDSIITEDAPDSMLTEDGAYVPEAEGELTDSDLTPLPGASDSDLFFDEETVLAEPHETGEHTGEADLSASSGAVIYDLNQMEPFRNRTAGEIAKRFQDAFYSGQSYVNGLDSSYYSRSCSVTFPYDEGRLKEGTLKVLHSMTDYYRWLAGAPPLKRQSTVLLELQKAALVRNISYGTEVSGRRPSDFDEGLWNTGAKARIDVLTHHQTPCDSIVKMLNTGYNRSAAYWYSMKNREILLDPELSWISYGYSGDVLAGSAREFRNTPVCDFTAFPSPGYMPSEAVDSLMSAWSIGISGSHITISDESLLRVRVENVDTGGNYTCSIRNGRLMRSGNLIAFVQPASHNGYDGKNYQVRLTGLTDASGCKAEVVYQIHFTGIKELVSSRVTHAGPEFSSLMFGTWADDTENLWKIASILPKTVTVTTDTGSTMDIPVAGSWSVDRRYRCFRSRADALKLPSGVTDPLKILEHLSIPYTVKDNQDTELSRLVFHPGEAIIGSVLDIEVMRCDAGYNRSRVYRLMQGTDGSYRSELWLDSGNSSSFVKSSYSSLTHLFRLRDADADLEGTCIAIYNYSQFTDTAYVTQPETLAFKKPAVSYRVFLRGSTWREEKTDGEAAGCIYFSRRVDALRIRIRDEGKLGIRYSFAKNGGGWSAWTSNGSILGRTDGKGASAEAVKIRLSGLHASKYDLYYCVYAGGYGWLGWTKNGKPAGTRDQSSDIRSIRVLLVRKGASPPVRSGRTAGSYLYRKTG